MPGNQLLLETQRILDDARGLLDHLPPMSPDHENVRLAVVKLRQTQASLSTQTEISGKVLTRSRSTIYEARTIVDSIRGSIAKRSRLRPQQGVYQDRDDAVRTSDGQHGPVTVFLDVDTVLLVQHRGRYGPELGLQADLSDAIGRLFEIADRVVAVVNPSDASGGHVADTAERVATLRAGLETNHDGLVVATCEHAADAACDCAKPGHGLISRHLGPDRRAEDGWYVGGDQEGMVAGRSAGLRTVRIGPHGDDHLSAVHRPDYEARDLMDAANHIMVETLSAP